MESGRPNAKKCPTCRVGLAAVPIRCLAAEQVIASLPRNCSHCGQQQTRGTIAAHEASCPQRPKKKTIQSSWAGHVRFEQPPPARQYANGICKVLKQLHPERKLTAEAVVILHDVIFRALKRVVTAAAAIPPTDTIVTKAEYAGEADPAKMVVDSRDFPYESFLCISPDEDVWVSADQLRHLGFADEIDAFTQLSEVQKRARLEQAKLDAFASCGELLDADEMNTPSLQTAVRLIMRSELAKRAVSEGSKAVCRFAAKGDSKEQRTCAATELSANAGLQFPVAVTGYEASRFSARSLSRRGAVYLTAVLE